MSDYPQLDVARAQEGLSEPQITLTFVASLELQLLLALSAGAKTVSDVARALGIRHAEAARELNAATMSGLIAWEDVDGHFTSVDVARRFAHVSTAGLKRLQRLQDDEAAGR